MVLLYYRWNMQTHVKEAALTLGTFVSLIATVHAGIWFHLFGVPDVTILNWPFHYFWLAIGGWVSIFTIYGVYHLVTDRLEEEKRQLEEEKRQLGDRAAVMTGASATNIDEQPNTGGD